MRSVFEFQRNVLVFPKSLVLTTDVYMNSILPASLRDHQIFQNNLILNTLHARRLALQ